MDQSLKVWPFWEGGIEQLTSPAKRVAAGSFCHLHWVCIAHCTECATDNVLSRTHPVCVIWLPGIIIKVRSSWISRGYWKLLHAHYSHMPCIFCQKIGSKKVKLGTHLDRCVYKVSAIFSEHFRFKYLIMTHTSCTQRASNVFWPMWNVQIWKSFEKTCCCVYQRMPTIRRRTLERFGMQVQQRWLNMRSSKHLKWVEQPASAYISTWTLGRVCI